MRGSIEYLCILWKSELNFSEFIFVSSTFQHYLPQSTSWTSFALRSIIMHLFLIFYCRKTFRLLYSLHCLLYSISNLNWYCFPQKYFQLIDFLLLFSVPLDFFHDDLWKNMNLDDVSLLRFHQIFLLSMQVLFLREKHLDFH